MPESLFALSLALRSAGTPALVPANLAGRGPDEFHDDRHPIPLEDFFARGGVRQPDSCGDR